MPAFPLGRVAGAGYTTFRSGRLSLAVSDWAVSVTGLFQSWSFRSREISVRLWNLAEVLYVRFLIHTYLNQRKVLFKKTTIMIQDPTVIIMNVW